MTTSPSGMTITSQSPIIDLAGNTWNLLGGVAYVNEKPQTVTHGIELLLSYAPKAGKLGIWQQTAQGWWEALSVTANVVTWGSMTTNPATVVTPPPPPPAPGRVHPMFGVHLGNWLGGGQGTEGNTAQHYADVTAEMGKPPQIIGAVLINSYLNSKGAPSTWQWNDAGNWTAANGLPMDGSAVPLLWMRLTDGETTDNDYTGWANGTYDAPFEAALAAWKTAAPNIKTYYIRPNVEFNSNYQSAGVPSAAQVPNWIAALKHLCNVAHTWGNANGVHVRMVWCPDTSATSNGATSFNLPVMNFFPMPDANAVNGRYFDVIGPDMYWDGYPGQMNAPTSPLASCIDWSFPTFVAIAAAAGCNVGLSENGDDANDNFDAYAPGGAMATFAAYANAMSVPLEFVVLYDVNGGVARQISGGGNPSEMAAYRSMLGTGGNGSIVPIMTSPPI